MGAGGAGGFGFGASGIGAGGGGGAGAGVGGATIVTTAADAVMGPVGMVKRTSGKKRKDQVVSLNLTPSECPHLFRAGFVHMSKKGIFFGNFSSSLQEKSLSLTRKFPASQINSPPSKKGPTSLF